MGKFREQGPVQLLVNILHNLDRLNLQFLVTRFEFLASFETTLIGSCQVYLHAKTSNHIIGSVILYSSQMCFFRVVAVNRDLSTSTARKRRKKCKDILQPKPQNGVSLFPRVLSSLPGSVSSCSVSS